MCFSCFFQGAISDASLRERDPRLNMKRRKQGPPPLPGLFLVNFRLGKEIDELEGK